MVMAFAACLAAHLIISDNPLSLRPPTKDNTYKNSSDYIGVDRFIYNGHDYIIFYYKGSNNSIVHDPECRKCKPI